MTTSPCPKWPQPTVSAKSSPVMLLPSVVDGTATSAISGAQRSLGDTRNGGVGIEQGGQLPAPRGGRG